MVVGLLVAGLMAAGCRSGWRGKTASDAPPEEVSPIVQVRAFPRSTAVAVVGWTKEEGYFGVRTAVRRDGDFAGLRNVAEHTVYVDQTVYGLMGGAETVAVGDVPPAAVMPRGGVIVDDEACRGGTCSPRRYYAFGLADSVLRGGRDSLVVNFYTTQGRNWALTLPKDLLEAYRTKVDSVAGAMRHH